MKYFCDINLKVLNFIKPILKMNYQFECEFCSRQLTDEDGNNYCNDCLYGDNENMENIIRGVLQVPPQPSLERRNCELAVPVQVRSLPNIEACHRPNVNDLLFSQNSFSGGCSWGKNVEVVSKSEESQLFGFDDNIIPELLDKDGIFASLKKNDNHDYELNLDNGIDENECEDDEEKYDLEYDFPRIPLERSDVIRPPLRLRRNEDLYRLISNEGEIIKSWITDEEVPNYVYDEVQECIVKIDPFLEDEDRRLLLKNCELAENY